VKLQDAARLVQGKRTPHGLQAMIAKVKRVLRYPYERANRLARYVVITRAYQKGEDVNRIAKRFGCGRGTVLRYARMAGLPVRPKHFPAAVRRAVLRDYRRGDPVAEIARLHEVSPAYVSTAARQAGILRIPKPRRSKR
jgi:transposase-like protein